MEWKVRYDVSFMEEPEHPKLVTPDPNVVQEYLTDYGCGHLWDVRQQAKKYVNMANSCQWIQIHHNQNTYRLYHSECIWKSLKLFVRQRWRGITLMVVSIGVVVAAFYWADYMDSQEYSDAHNIH